jgi:hypothetical protein
MVSSNLSFKRLLAGAIAMASLTTAATSVYAANLANFSTSKWAGKDTSVGDFGAGYGASFTMDLTDGALTGQASGDASIQLFGTTVSIVDLSATASINDSSSDAAKLIVEVVGVEVYTKSFSDGFTFDASEDVSSYEDTFCTEFFDVSTTIMVGVVPVTMSAGAEGCANLVFGATPQYNTTTKEAILNLDLTPSVGVDLAASVGAGTSSFSVGVEAEVTLLDFSLPITLDPKYKFDTAAFSYDSSGSIDLSMLDGAVSLYAKADLGFWDVKYTKKLFEWDGISKTWYLWSTGKPTASSPTAPIEGGTAYGAYNFADTAGTSEGSSTYVWYRNSIASDTGRSSISSSKDHTIVEADAGKWLQFCVTPKNSVGTPGDQQCSDWEYVGKLASFYQHNDYSGTNVAIAYEKSPSGTCFNLDDYVSTFDNDTSSYKLWAPSDSSATFHFHKGYDCNDTASSEYQQRTVSAGGSSQQTSTGNLGSTWNDRLTSVMVVFNELVTAENVAVSISGNTATAAYAFSVGNSVNTTESGSTFKWYRASSSSGTSSALISGSTDSTHTLGYSDDRKYLKVCVTPSNGYTTGSESCSGWMAVGHLLKFFEDDNNGGDHVAIAWEKSERETCFNLTDYSFNDKVSSYNWYNNSNAGSTVWLYKDINCSGSSATRTVSAGGSEAISSVNSTFGSSWNDSVTSFRVSWTSSVNISTPAVAIWGNKATESHTYSDTSGLSESATYTWWRASSASGSSAVQVANATSSEYMLSADDNKKYLKVCVHSSNGVNVDEEELCTGWKSVGSLMQFFADANLGGGSVNIAYQNSPSGTCFNLADFSFNDFTSSYRAYAPTSGSATFYTYRSDGCSNANPTNDALSANGSIAWNLNGVSDNTRSSLKVVY